MIKYPLTFGVRGEARAGIVQTWTAAAAAHASPLALAIPPEFDGPGGGLSPEDVYALALLNCYTATFKVFAEKSRLQYDALTSEGALTVDRDEKGTPWMSAFHLRVALSGVAQADLARRLLERVSQACMIINSVKTKCTFDFDVTPGTEGTL